MSWPPSGPRAVIAGPSAKATLAGLDRAALPELEHVITSEGAELAGAVGLDALVATAPGPMVDRAAEDLAVLVFTSGTAGSPKAAKLTHGNLLANLEQCQAHPGRAQQASDVAFGVLPFFHIFGLNVVLGLSFVAGATVVTIERFDPQSGIETITNHGVTVISGAPTMWAAWAYLPGVAADAFTHVRLATSGAARLDPETRAAMFDRYAVDLTEGYGLTEASPVVQLRPRPRRAGRQHRRAAARAVGAAGRRRRPGRAGGRPRRDLGAGPERVRRVLG